jgi:hypothetical protein
MALYLIASYWMKIDIFPSFVCIARFPDVKPF